MNHADLPPVRVFIGSGEASRVERKTLISTLKQHCSRTLDLHVFNGTHNAFERNELPPVPAPLPLHLKYRNYTEFSLYRFLIPEICEHQGRAIWLDSDTISLRDIAELFDRDMQGADLLAKPDYGDQRWATSVLLINCATCRFDLEQIFRDIDAGRYSYADFTQLAPQYLHCHDLKVGPLEEHWNSFDRFDQQTRILHYTDLNRQPWKYTGHPAGKLWFRCFNQALQDGTLTREDIDLSIARGYVRTSIRDGNRPGPWWWRAGLRKMSQLTRRGVHSR
jgi:lipopolysaccharide biosynthesis glycosyltransferase